MGHRGDRDGDSHARFPLRDILPGRERTLTWRSQPLPAFSLSSWVEVHGNDASRVSPSGWSLSGGRAPYPQLLPDHRLLGGPAPWPQTFALFLLPGCSLSGGRAPYPQLPSDHRLLGGRAPWPQP